MSVEVKNITKIYAVQKALDDVSFRISQGEIVGLLGPNGAGKSTLMKIISCFIPPTSGEAFVHGYDVLDDPVSVRKHVGYLPENNPLYLDMYVKEYLSFISGIHHLKDIRKRVADIIDITGLGLEQGKKIGALSKGYRQRVGLAAVLIHDPDVLILDEPTSGLDPNQIVEIRELIRKIGKEKTIIFSTHIMQEVEALCDRAIIINQGKIIADDRTERLSDTSSDIGVISVEFDKEINIELLQNIKGVKNLKTDNKKTWEIETDAESDIRPEIFNLAVKNKITVLAMNKETRSLESVFQQLTKNK